MVTDKPTAPVYSHGPGGEVEERPMDLSRDADVPCGQCTLCCRGMIALFPSLGDDMSLDKVAFLGGRGEFTDDLTGKTISFTHFLKTKPEDGTCVYLDPNKGCTIYSRRPTVCRSFDCRKLVRSLTRQQLRASIRSGKFRQELVDRGKELEALRKATEEEEPNMTKI